MSRRQAFQTMAQFRQIGVPATATKSSGTSPEPRVRGLLLQIRPPVDLDQHALCRGDFSTSEAAMHRIPHFAEFQLVKAPSSAKPRPALHSWLRPTLATSGTA